MRFDAPLQKKTAEVLFVPDAAQTSSTAFSRALPLPLRVPAAPINPPLLPAPTPPNAVVAAADIDLFFPIALNVKIGSEKSLPIFCMLYFILRVFPPEHSWNLPQLPEYEANLHKLNSSD